MGIVVHNGVHPKRGRLATGSFFGAGDSPIPGDPFPSLVHQTILEQQRGSGLPGATNLRMHDNRIGGTVPTGQVLGTRRDVSTIARRNPIITVDATQGTILQTPKPKPYGNTRQYQVMPHEKLKFHRHPTPVVKTQFGGATTTGLPADTAFNRIPKQRYFPPINQTPVTGERTNAFSFVSRNNMWYDRHNSFVHERSNAASLTLGTGRWNTVKRGAAG